MAMFNDKNDLSASQKSTLMKQWNNAKYINAEPDTLDIFDFDATLFLSPLLSPNLWHNSLITAITTENLLGPGWWRDIRSLSVDHWHGFWNKGMVAQAKESISDPSRLSVLLTGRRYHPFHTLIDRMLSSVGLSFDMVALRPDPEKDTLDAFRYNLEPNVFESTMEYKICFINNVLTQVPSLKNIVMWDDRLSHVHVFESYLSTLVSHKLIDSGIVHCVKPSRPCYNPQWEFNTVQSIIEIHNKALEIGELKSIVKIVNHGQIITSANAFRLNKIPYIPVLHFSRTVTDGLKSVFTQVYEKEIACNSVSDWELGAEVPVYSGNCVLLADCTQVKVIARSRASIEDGMMLKVQAGNDTCILPLWYKPSRFIFLTEIEYAWVPVKPQLIKGTLGHHELYSIEAI